MLDEVWEKQRNRMITVIPKTIGKVETDTINRERRKTMIAVQVKTYLTHINSQKTKPLLKVQKIMVHANWNFASGSDRGKPPIFWKIRPYKQRREEIFEKLEIQNYDENDTNKSDQQNEHIIIVPDTEDVPNNVKENVSNFVSVNFSFSAKV